MKHLWFYQLFRIILVGFSKYALTEEDLNLQTQRWEQFNHNLSTWRSASFSTLHCFCSHSCQIANTCYHLPWRLYHLTGSPCCCPPCCCIYYVVTITENNSKKSRAKIVNIIFLWLFLLKFLCVCVLK